MFIVYIIIILNKVKERIILCQNHVQQIVC
nr:MAG TPA: hypothetical protein [Caudoviricetes sp.]